MEKGAQLGENVHVGPYCVIGPAAAIGDSTRLIGGTTVMGRTTIGRENTIHPYAVIGGFPQDFKYAGGDTRVEIGDSNVIREHVTINVGTESGGGVTSVGNGNFLMCACHVAHDCYVDDDCIMANNVLLAGHVRIGRGAVLSGAVAVHHFTTIGEFAFVGGLTRIVRDVVPFLITEGNPGEERSVNVIGLRRNGFDEDAIAALDAAFRAIFRSGEPMSIVLGKLEAAAPTRDVARLLEFLRNRSRGKHGRMLQP